MKISELRSEMGMEVRTRRKLSEPTIRVTVSVAISKSEAKNMLTLVKQDQISQSEFIRRLILFEINNRGLK